MARRHPLRGQSIRLPATKDVKRSRSRRRTLIGVVAALCVLAATAGLEVTRNQRGKPVLPLAPLTTLGELRRAPDAGRPGPEAVPIPTGPSLASPRPLDDGQQIDGITCETEEQVAFHIHAHVRIVVRGRSRQVPAGVGVAAPYDVELTPSGRFVAGGSCFMWLHTHAADGIVHIESPVERTYTLGEFFDVWGQPLDRRRVGRARGTVTALVNARVFTGNPRKIPLLAHSQIELEVGRPLVTPDTIGFPLGL
jgi:hypothetical protein